MTKLPVRKRKVGTSSKTRAHLSVFCPGKGRSMAFDHCRTCDRAHRVDEQGIDCSPVTESSLATFLERDPRFGGDALVGQAMGNLVLCAYLDTPAGELSRAMRRERLRAALVIDEADRYLGIAEGPDVDGSPADACLHRILRSAAPVHERSRLASAVERMVRERTRVLAVVDDEGQPVGMLSDLDALHWVGRSHRKPTPEEE